MILEEFAFIAADTARSKAYLQEMMRAKRLPAVCIVYAKDFAALQQEAAAYHAGKETEENRYFDRKRPLLRSLQEAGIPWIPIQNQDINAEEMADAIGALKQTYVIFSGYGGQILKKPLFQLGKQWIHVHAGLLPQYRGSTTAYYSLLQEQRIGATAIFLNEGIDEGEIILQKDYRLPQEEVDIDYIYEPFIRAQVLLQVLDRYVKNGKLESKKQSQAEAETYYIIHPVLKHLAILGCAKQ